MMITAVFTGRFALQSSERPYWGQLKKSRFGQNQLGFQQQGDARGGVGFISDTKWKQVLSPSLPFRVLTKQVSDLARSNGLPRLGKQNTNEGYINKSNGIE